MDDQTPPEPMLDASAVEVSAEMKDRFGVAALEKANDALRVAKLAGHQSSVALWTEVAAILWRDQGWS